MRRPVRRAVRLAGAAFDALVPAACVVCRRGVEPTGVPLCGVCRSRLPRLPSPRCARCAQPLGNLAAAAGERVPCGTCESWPDVLVAADAPFAFDGLARRTVSALKYDRWAAVAPYMADSMAGAVERVARRLGGGGAMPLVPVPLAPARLRERGFNQAEALARALSERGLGPLALALERRAGGGRQAALRGALRAANVRGRFRPRTGFAAEGDAAILVDDVLTTGATAVACTEALVEAGFQCVATVSFARTLRPLDVDPSTARARRP